MEPFNATQKVQEEYQSIKPQINVVLLLLQSLGVTIMAFAFIGFALTGSISVVLALLGVNISVLSTIFVGIVSFLSYS